MRTQTPAHGPGQQQDWGWQCPAWYLHDNIVAVIGQPGITQLLHVALEELHVRLLVAKLVHVVGNVLLRHLNLGGGRE